MGVERSRLMHLHGRLLPQLLPREYAAMIERFRWAAPEERFRFLMRTGVRYCFVPEPPRTGAEQAANADSELERFLHLWAMNRRILMTPFHNMALMSPATSEADVDRHTEVFEAAVVALFA